MTDREGRLENRKDGLTFRRWAREEKARERKAAGLPPECGGLKRARTLSALHAEEPKNRPEGRPLETERRSMRATGEKRPGRLKLPAKEAGARWESKSLGRICFGWLLVRAEALTAYKDGEGSFDCAARRAIVWRGRESLAAPLRMTDREGRLEKRRADPARQGWPLEEQDNPRSDGLWQVQLIVRTWGTGVLCPPTQRRDTQEQSASQTHPGRKLRASALRVAQGKKAGPTKTDELTANPREKPQGSRQSAAG